MPRLLWSAAAAAVFIATTQLDTLLGSATECGDTGPTQMLGTALCNPVMRFVGWLAVASFVFWVVAGAGTLVLGGMDALNAFGRRLRR